MTTLEKIIKRIDEEIGELRYIDDESSFFGSCNILVGSPDRKFISLRFWDYPLKRWKRVDVTIETIPVASYRYGEPSYDEIKKALARVEERWKQAVLERL